MAKIAGEVDPEARLLDYVRRVNLRAEALQTCGTHLSKVSTDTARKARKGVLEAVARLQISENVLVNLRPPPQHWRNAKAR